MNSEQINNEAKIIYYIKDQEYTPNPNPNPNPIIYL